MNGFKSVGHVLYMQKIWYGNIGIDDSNENISMGKEAYAERKSQFNILYTVKTVLFYVYKSALLLKF